jgi:hypothetical protein
MTSWNPLAGGATPNTIENNLESTSEFSKLTKLIEDGKEILKQTKQISGVTQATLDEYTEILKKIEEYYDKTAATDTPTNINTKHTTFDLETKKFLTKSAGDVAKQAALDAEAIEKAKEPVNIPNEMTKTAIDILYTILYCAFVLWAGSVGANLAFQLYKENGSYTFYYFIYTALLAAAYSLAVSQGFPYLTPYKESRFVRLMFLIGFQLLCIGIFFATTLSKGLVFRAWLLPLVEGEGRGFFSYGGPRSPLPPPGWQHVVLPPLPETPTPRINPEGVSALLNSAATKRTVAAAFAAPTTAVQASSLTTKPPI